MSMSVHLYGIVPEGASLPSTVRGRQEAPLRTVCHGRLAAIVSDVDPEMRIGREDLLAHAHVLEAVVEDSTVLPMRFGVILGSDDELAEQVLHAGEERLLSLLTEFDDLQQLTVRAVHDEEEVLRTLLAQNTDVRAFRDSMAAGGETYQAKLELGRLVADGIENIARTDAAYLLDELAPLARDIKIEDGSKRQNVLDAALLVSRVDRSRVDEAIAKLGSELPPRLRLRYVGPQPPYAFIDTALAGERVWD
jgi:Gas vesicle synthesis protein GvpL/GvpF